MPALSTSEQLALLGFPAGARLLIVNGDDLGSAQASNAATARAITEGVMTAASLMVVCPWATGAARTSINKGLDVGIHLTFTAEWDPYKWGPVLGRDQVPSLVDEFGYFYPNEDLVWQRGDPEEVLAEGEAQIQRAYRWGLEPTNVDGHMSTLYYFPAFLVKYIELARRHRLPMRITRERAVAAGLENTFDTLPLDGILFPDAIRGIELEEADDRKAALLETLESLPPGITELIAHVADDTPESQAMMRDWEARVDALRLMLDPDIAHAIEANDIHLIGWRDLRDAQRRLAP